MSCTSSGSKCDASSLYSTSSQNSEVTWRRSKIGGVAGEGGRPGLPTLERTALGGGEPADRVKQAPAMTDGTDAEFRHIRAGQMRQHGRVDVVVEERPHIGP